MSNLAADARSAPRTDAREAAGPALSATALFAAVSPAVVVVHSVLANGGSVQGSAVVLSEPVLGAQILVTNAHVVMGANAVAVVRGEERWPARTLYYDAQADIALLSVAPPNLWPSVSIGNPFTLQVGMPTFAVGSPLGLENSLSTGIVSALRTRAGLDLIQTTAPISPGSSGGGLFDDHGQLVGVTTFKLRGGENLNFAVSVATVLEIRQAFGAGLALSVLVAGESDAPRLAALNRRGDIPRWLRNAPSRQFPGQRAYADVWALTAAFGKSHYVNLRPDVVALLDRIEADIAHFPLPTMTAPRDSVQCEMKVADQLQRQDYEFDRENSVVRSVSADRSFHGNFRNGAVDWTEDLDSGALLHVVFDTVAGSMVVYMADDFRALRRGDVVMHGRCRKG